MATTDDARARAPESETPMTVSAHNQTATAKRRHRIVVVGGGFGGLFATRFLRKGDVEITLIDRTNHHLFQPLLYQVATGILSEGQISPPLRGILRKRRNVQVELAEVTGFDLENRRVLAVRPGGQAITYPYDSLIVASGSTTSYFGHDELAEYSLPMKTIDDALNVRRRIFAAFELAETAPSEAERRRWLTFAVVGGGPTGCEVAGQIAELARRTLERDFRAIDPTNAAVILLEADTQILRTFGDRPVPQGNHRAWADGRGGSHRHTGNRHRRRWNGCRDSGRPGAHPNAHRRLGSRSPSLTPRANVGRCIRSGVRPGRSGRRSTRTARCKGARRCSSLATRWRSPGFRASPKSRCNRGST